MSDYINRLGHYELWAYFGLSRTSFVTLPLAFMHEMPDEWQAKMATVLHEWDETLNWPDAKSALDSSQSSYKWKPVLDNRNRRG